MIAIGPLRARAILAPRALKVAAAAPAIALTNARRIIGATPRRRVAAGIELRAGWAEPGFGDQQVAANPVAANELFERAAAKGHSGAMSALGAMRGGGHGLPIDRPIAQR